MGVALRAYALAGNDGQTSRSMTAAIYFHPEAYTTSGPKLMGRNAAGESFLRGYVKHSSATWTASAKRCSVVLVRRHCPVLLGQAKAVIAGEPAS